MDNKIVKQIFAVMFAIILIISCCIGLDIYVQKNGEVINNGTSLEDLDNMIEDNKDDQTQDDTSPKEPEENKPVQVYRNGYKCVEDAFKFLDNCKGYKVTTSFNGVTDVMGMGKVVQRVKDVVIQSGDYYLKESHAQCGSSLGQNNYKYFYSNDNGKNVSFKKTSVYKDGKPDWNYKVAEETASKEVMIQKYDAVLYDIFNVRASKNNSTLVKFDRSTKYYIVSFILDTNKIPEKYIKSAIMEGGLKSMNVKSLKLTYYIEKETLYLRKIERNELYTVDVGLSLDIEAYQEYIINVIDKDLRPNLPDYCR